MIRTTLIWLACLFLPLANPTLCLAAPATDTSVAKLLRATGADQFPVGPLKQFEAAQATMAAGIVKSAGVADAARLQAWKQEAAAAAADVKAQFLSPEIWGQEAARVYRAQWSEEEISELLKFFESPVGKKAARELPALASRLDAIANEKNRAAILEVSQRYYALRAKHWPESASTPPGFNAKPQSKPKPIKKIPGK